MGTDSLTRLKQRSMGKFGVPVRGNNPLTSAEGTMTDVATGAMAFQAARFGRKMAKQDAELEQYRRRMNALADAQAIKLGADPEDLQQPIAGDDMHVYTNSPVSNYRCEAPDVVQVPSAMTAWLAGILGALAVVACTILMIWFIQNPIPTPPPVVPTPPATVDGDLHIEIIPAGEM